jgi:DNA-binding MarR family transcriptional regulator
MSDLDDSIKTRFSSDKHRMLANIVFSANWIKNDFNQFIKPFGLSSQQFNILRILRGKGDWMTMNDIKSVMIDKSPHTTRMVTKLLDKGLVDRKRSDKDRRIIFVGITKEGLDQLAEIDKKAEDTPRFIDNYSEEEARLVNSILDKMRG